MSAIKKYKRPSSARRHIRQEEFSGFVSSTRLQRIQNLLGNNESSESSDSVLCIAGIDSRYNEGMSELINYLLFDFFELRRKEIERSGFEEEVVEDLMFLVRKDSVDVYCNPINYMYLLPYIAHWKNLRIHCLKDEDYEDEEKAEEFKILSFINMTKPCSKVAIPFSGSSHEQQFDIMKIEKWPIIQAFALEGMGGGGFFTMKYEVEDISEVLVSVYQLLDPVSVESLVTEHLPLFERQWDSLLSNIEVVNGDKLSKLSGSYLVEPLKSYFSHGRIGSAKGSKRLVCERHPFVLVGTDTEKTQLEHAGRSGISSKDSVANTGLTGQPALHMVCQAVSPKSPICCRRTYFFSNGVLPHPIYNSSGDQVNEKQDVRILLLVYMACIEALLAAIDVYVETLNLSEAKQICMHTLLECWDRLQIPVSSSHIATKENVEFKLEAFDNHNTSVSLSDVRSQFLAKCCSVTVYNIPSIEKRGETVGSVSFGETFLNSSLQFESGGDDATDGSMAILTSHIPRIVTWQMSAVESHLYETIMHALTQDESDSEILGEKIIPGESIYYVQETDHDFIVRDGLLYIYEEGVIYTHPQHGIIVVPKAEMTAIHLYDGDSPSIVALLIISYQEHVQEYIPIQMRNQYNRLILAFEPKSKAYKKLFTGVLPKWKMDDAKPELQRMEEEVPEELKLRHEKLQAAYKLSSGPASKQTPLAEAKETIDGLSEFLPHFEATSVSPGLVPRKHVSLVAGREWDAGSFGGAMDELVISVISGLPASGKMHLCQVINRIAKSDSRWTIIKPPIDSLHVFDKEQLQNLLRSTYLAYKHRRGESVPATKMRAIIVTPGFTDVRDVIQTVLNHPDKELAKKKKVPTATLR